VDGDVCLTDYGRRQLTGYLARAPEEIRPFLPTMSFEDGQLVCTPRPGPTVPGVTPGPTPTVDADAIRKELFELDDEKAKFAARRLELEDEVEDQRRHHREALTKGEELSATELARRRQRRLLRRTLVAGGVVVGGAGIIGLLAAEGVQFALPILNLSVDITRPVSDWFHNPITSLSAVTFAAGAAGAMYCLGRGVVRRAPAASLKWANGRWSEASREAWIGGFQAVAMLLIATVIGISRADLKYQTSRLAGVASGSGADGGLDAGGFDALLFGALTFAVPLMAAFTEGHLAEWARRWTRLLQEEQSKDEAAVVLGERRAQVIRELEVEHRRLAQHQMDLRERERRLADRAATLASRTAMHERHAHELAQQAAAFENEVVAAIETDRVAFIQVAHERDKSYLVK
jgi:hypothetical protein